MPKFTYKALRKEDNTTFEATVEAKDRFEVYSIVRKEGAQVLSVHESSKGGSLGSIDLGKLFGRVNGMDRVLITRNLGAMLRAGLTVTRALSVIERQTRKTKLKEILHAMNADIEKGAQLSDAMKKHPKAFPSIVTAMVRAGEESGTLSDTLRTISEQLEQSVELQKKVKGAMLYPSIIISVLLIIGALMLIFIVPTLTSTFAGMGVELPASTKFVIALSDFVIAHTLLALVLLVAAIVGCVMALRTPAGKHAFEALFLKVPILGVLMKEVNSARTGRTLSSLLSSGVNMLQAIEITCDVVQNTHYRTVLAQAQEQVQQGKPLAEVFTRAEKLYPPLVGELIAVGEETGALPDMLKEVAEYYEREVSMKTKNMSTIIEPFLMLIIGGAVGFFAVSMISPIYSITSSM